MTALLEAPARSGGHPRPTSSRPSVGEKQPNAATSRNRAVQGLRALAVAAVVGDHLVQRPSGGFVGVDVFFVISGYLITGLLLRESDRTGRISIIDFYRRRIKRTAPLAVAVILVTLLVGSAILPAYRLQQLYAAAAAAGTFSINWQLIAIGADYLHASDAPTPLQHFWSLAVEEQFYLVWPALIIATTIVARRLLRRIPMRAAVAVLAAALTLGSGIWCVWQTAGEPTAAYFSTMSRGWELGAGALLATARPLFTRISAALCAPLAWAGFLALVGSMFVITPDSSFPAPWAAVPVVATMLIILASELRSDTQLYP
ncbi:acyltransferase family protein [Amnibacterium kyonggiense]